MRQVHRLANAEEKAAWPDAHTFNRASGRLHNRAGFEIAGSGPIKPPIRRKSRSGPERK